MIIYVKVWIESSEVVLGLHSLATAGVLRTPLPIQVDMNGLSLSAVHQSLELKAESRSLELLDKLVNERSIAN